MKICTIVINQIDLHALQEASNGEPVTMTTLPEGAKFIKMEQSGNAIHIIYSMEDEDPVREFVADVSKEHIERCEKLRNQPLGFTVKPNIWKQQQDLEQPDDSWQKRHEDWKGDVVYNENKLTPASRNLNQELLRQYKDKVTELEELLK